MTPSEQELVFLNAIAANQQDVAVRLAYSDWLEEQGRLEVAKYVRDNLHKKAHSYNLEIGGVEYQVVFSDNDARSRTLISPFVNDRYLTGIHRSL